MRLIPQFACISILLAMGAGNVIAQVPQPTTHVHERLLCVVPLVGAGSWADPKRPLFAPRNPSSSGILGYSFVTSDDGEVKLLGWILTNSVNSHNTPVIGPADSTQEFPTKNGKTVRVYGPDGRAVRDIDYGDQAHSATDPEVHDWDWSSGTPKRSPDRPPKPGEIP